VRAAETGVIVMPHLPDGTLGQSTGLVSGARHGEPCRVEIGDGLNTSYLEHFAFAPAAATAHATAPISPVRRSTRSDAAGTCPTTRPASRAAPLRLCATRSPAASPSQCNSDEADGVAR